MNHGFKINGNILEITIPDNIHINKVIVNRQIFSQRMQVCKSCKYHGLEGHEEPCVSCEVGNSNYVPSVELEEHTEERTETHACDCISRQAAIDAMVNELSYLPITTEKAYEIAEVLNDLPSAQPEQQWIPCSERLPKEKKEYLVTYHPCYWDNVTKEIKVGIDTFRGKTTWAKKKYQRVTAWMPLPETYMEVDE